MGLLHLFCHVVSPYVDPGLVTIFLTINISMMTVDLLFGTDVVAFSSDQIQSISHKASDKAHQIAAHSDAFVKYSSHNHVNNNVKTILWRRRVSVTCFQRRIFNDAFSVTRLLNTLQTTMSTTMLKRSDEEALISKPFLRLFLKHSLQDSKAFGGDFLLDTRSRLSNK